MEQKIRTIGLAGVTWRRGFRGGSRSGGGEKWSGGSWIAGAGTQKGDDASVTEAIESIQSIFPAVADVLRDRLPRSP